MIAVYIVIGVMVVLAGAVVFLIKPNRARDVSKFCGKEYAHRGLWSRDPEQKRPENSMAAFREAARLGIGVELDIQLTRDKKVVVFHDSGLKRMCGVDIELCNLDYSELSKYPLPNGETIPLFTDVLKALNGVPVVCEIKTGRGFKDVECCGLAKDMILSYKGDICIESFNPIIVEWFRKNCPEIIRGQLSCRFKGGDNGMGVFQAFAMENMLVNVLGRPDFVAYGYKNEAIGMKLCRVLWRAFCVAWTARGNGERAEAKAKYGTVIYEE